MAETPPLIRLVASPTITRRGLDEKASTGNLIDIAVIQKSGNAAMTTQAASPSAEMIFRAAGCSSERGCVIAQTPGDDHARFASAAA